MMQGPWGRRAMRANQRGFSMVELMIAILIIGIVAAIAIPIATTAIKDYRLHSDATSIASYLNVARMNAAAKYAPYRLIVSISQGTFVEEQLCGNTPWSAAVVVDPNTGRILSDPACTGAAPAYASYSTPLLVGGTQLLAIEDKFSSCRPAAITGSFPGTIIGDLSPCPDPLYIYFNTRGTPVDNTGSPLGNGGAVLYLTNPNNLTDAITVATGGRVAVYMWSGSAWVIR